MSEETPKEEATKPRPAAIAYNTPGSVSRLKKAYNFKLRMPDIKEFLAELNGESDRAAVILASSQLDDLLANAIALKMSEFADILVSDIEYIFRPSGPLGTFSARAEIANLFGVIENETYEQLTILREMRNACAHSKHPITFKDPLLRNVAIHLFEPKRATPRALAEKDMKIAFGLEIASLILVLGLGSREKARTERSMAFGEIAGMFPPSPGKPDGRSPRNIQR
jgi:DNA-binding MltR family transcriptional regulator